MHHISHETQREEYNDAKRDFQRSFTHQRAVIGKLVRKVAMF